MTRRDDLLASAVPLVQAAVPVILLLPRTKRPIPRTEPSEPWGRVAAVSDPEFIELAIDLALKEYGDCNLAIAVGQQKQSPLLSVDIDGPAGLEKAKELGVTSADDVWIERTASNNFQVFYYHPQRTDLDRKVAAGDLPLDLLVNGLATIPPSYAKGKDGTWRTYRWHKGPNDLALSELMEPPKALIDYWLSLESTSTAPHDVSPEDATDKAWQMASQPIGKGGRNEELCKIAGWLVNYHPLHIVDTLLQSINTARCEPPLPPREVSAIARSVDRYGPSERDGHPRAVNGESNRRANLEDLIRASASD